MSKETVEELERKLALAKKEQVEAEQRERAEYVRLRDEAVTVLCTMAVNYNHALMDFSKNAFKALDKQAKALEKYGKLRKNSKGGFTLTTEDKLFRVKYAYNSISDFDERANKAETLLKDFLQDFIKKKDKGAYEIIINLLERNAAGSLEFSRISKLYELENNYTDPRWVEAIKLFKESFRVRDSKMQPYFYRLNARNEYELINLNFSSL